MQALNAVIWDFDGTLVDSTAKNLAVTRALLRDVVGEAAVGVPALRDLPSYRGALARHRSWQEFYREDLGLSDAQAAHAASLWLEYQLRDETIPEPFEGIAAVVESLAHLPQAIVSLNARDNILRLVTGMGLASHFRAVFGFEAVAPHQQKPAPEALLLCIDEVTAMQPGRVLYVGDHESDTRCVVAANARLQQQGLAVEVLAIAALFGDSSSDEAWETAPHYRAHHPAEVLEIVATISAG